jgi:hypothetical protein
MSSHPGENSRFNTDAAVNATPPYRTCSNVVNAFDEFKAGGGVAFLFDDSCTHSFLFLGGDNS